jgi:hypothetical protein
MHIHTPTMQIHIPVRAPLRPVHKPLLAERFKTRLCDTFERQGYCSYDARCMFAHGCGDLRSKEMNLLDGLVTDDAIRNFAAQRYGAVATTVDPHRTILAERFKTRSCENFKRHGECTFAHRCMFAHGEEELRTTEMNIRDGLTTEEAIKTFQSECITTLREAERRRKRNLKKKTKVRAAKDARRQLFAGVAGLSDGDSPGPSMEPASVSVEVLSEYGGAYSETPQPSVAISTFTVATATPGGRNHSPSGPRRHRHDPYTPVLLGYGAAVRWSGGSEPQPALYAATPLTGVDPPVAAAREQEPPSHGGTPLQLRVAVLALYLRLLTAPTVHVPGTAPLFTLPPSRAAQASAQSVLLP